MPQIFQSFLGKKQEHRETFLSLYLDSHSIAASFWSVIDGKAPENLGWANINNIEDNWEARAEVADRVIGELEEKTRVTDVTKVILGLPLGLLSPTGEIRKEVRKEIKELMSELDLTPVGFVPIYQAIIYKLKHDEGVPPSVILLGMNNTTIVVSLYKIGTLVGVREIEKTKDIASSVEESLKSFTDLEVLPARMFLYGLPQGSLEEAKSELLRHSWTTTASFLHFPKIDVISDLFIVDAISLAGASELGTTVDDASEKEVPVTQKQVVEAEKTEVEAETREKPIDVVTQEVQEAQEAIAEDLSEPEKKQNEDANVVMVDAESLGFKKDTDVLEEQEQIEEVKQRGVPQAPIAIPKVDVGKTFDSLKRIISGFGGRRN